MSWMWLNIPLMVLVFLGVSGIPLWLVLTRPDFSGQPDAESPQPETVRAGHAAQPVISRPHPVALANHRELAGAGQRG